MGGFFGGGIRWDNKSMRDLIQPNKLSVNVGLDLTIKQTKQSTVPAVSCVVIEADGKLATIRHSDLHNSENNCCGEQ